MRIEKALLIILLVFVITSLCYQVQASILKEFKLIGGGGVSIDGDRCIVGATGDDDNGYKSGAAYIFEFNGVSWIERQKLTASDGAEGDLFGVSVSINGDRCIVGAPADDDNGDFSGSAYIFDFNGTSWTEQTKLTASDGAGYDYFGYSVAIGDTRCIVGAYRDDDNGDLSGSAYIFDFNGTTWIEQQKLLASDAGSDDYFGIGVGIDDDFCVVGAPGDDDIESGSGAAYIFDFNGTSWTEQTKLKASDPDLNDDFGCSVSISGDRCIVGARENDDSGRDRGSAYIFEPNGIVWVEQQKLIASDSSSDDWFGWSVSISGDRCIVGARHEGINSTGSAYIFEFNGMTWIEQAKLTASDGVSYNYFGSSVSISDDSCIVGTGGNDSAYVYSRICIASLPNPASEAKGIDVDTILSWYPGKDAASHDVYFGTDFNDVNDAHIFSDEYMGNFDVISFDPCGLDIMTWYYWRVDEVNEANSTWKGDVWSFRTTSPMIELSETYFDFRFPTGGDNPYDQVLTIRNSGILTLNWAIDYDCNWLDVYPLSGSSTGDINEVVLSVETNGLDPNNAYYCDLTISDPNAENSPQIVEVVLGHECFPSDHPDYDEWVSVGKPDCWCCPKQCHGDATGSDEQFGHASWVSVGFHDFQILLQGYNKSGYSNPVTHPWIAADFTHSDEEFGRGNYVRVGFQDFQVLLTYYNDLYYTVPADCLDAP